MGQFSVEICTQVGQFSMKLNRAMTASASKPARPPTKGRKEKAKNLTPV